jgi:hypothetical protein
VTPIPPTYAVIEVHVGELSQLFDAINPSPFRERDLHPKAAAVRKHIKILVQL